MVNIVSGDSSYMPSVITVNVYLEEVDRIYIIALRLLFISIFVHC